MKQLIKNPVSHNPWAPDMPNNFQGCEAAKAKKHPAQPINFNVVKPKPVRSRRPRKPSAKLQLTRTYSDQLAPLYPFLNKTQVKSALTLTNNNLYQSRLLLDVANKFLKTEPANQTFSFYSKTLSEGLSSWENKSSTEVDTSTVTLNTSGDMKSSGSDTSRNEKNNNSSTSSASQSELGSSSTASSKSNSSVYEFGQTEYNTAPIQSWSSHKKQAAKKKIGVSIVRYSKGYRAFLL